MASNPDSIVLPTDNLFDWFLERVRDARATRGIDLSEEGTLYLVKLLVERARADLEAPPETTLAELHGRAANASPVEQMRAYRELGDRALFVVGYFPEALERRSVGPKYYSDMGAAAYARLDHVFKRWFANAFGDLYAELAARFRGAVDVVAEVRRSCREEPDAMMRLLQRWQDTGDDLAAQRLRQLGLVIPARPILG